MNTYTHGNAADRSAAMNRYREGKVAGKGLIGLSVVSLNDGKEVGHVHDVVYSPREGRLVGFTIPHNAGFFSRGDTLWLDASNIQALGEDAVVVQNSTSFRKYTESADAVAEAAGEPVIGKRLMTDDGTFLGAVEDVLIDRQTRRVVAYEVSGGLWQDMMQGQSDVPVDSIISIGEDVVVVPASVKQFVEQASGGLAAVAAAAKEKATEIKDATAEKIEQVRTEAAVAIEKREATYAVGRIAGRSVYLDEKDTVPLIKENETITQAHIEQAIPAGKMHALALAAGWQQAEDAAATARAQVGVAVTTAKEKAADLTESTKDKYGETLVGRTTGCAVVSDSMQLIVPGNHVVTAADVEMAEAAGKLDDLTAAVGVAVLDSAKANIFHAYDATKEQVVQTYNSAKAKVEDAYDASQERAAAEHAASTPSSSIVERTLANPAVLESATPPAVIIIQNPEQVVMQTPAPEAVMSLVPPTRITKE